MAITRITQGAFQDKTSLTSWTLTLTGAFTAGDLLVVGFSQDVASNNVQTCAYSTDGGTTFPNTLTSVSAQNMGGAGLNGFGGLFFLANAPGAASGQCKVKFTFFSATAAHAAFITEVSGIATVSPRDQNPQALDGSSATPSDTASTTLVASEIFIAWLGTNGPSGDTAGTWSNSWSSGQRLGTTGGAATGNWTVQEGFKIVSATESAQAALTGMTSRSWGIGHATFKAATSFVSPNPYIVSQAVNRAAVI